MAASETLVFDILARDAASPSFEKLGRTASSASDDVAGLSRRLDEIGRRAVDARVGVDDKAANAELDKLNVKLLTIGKRVANPKIDMVGVARAQADISAVDLALDKLGKKAAGQGPNWFQKLPGLIGLPGLFGEGGAGGAGGGGGAAAPAGGGLNPATIGGGAAAALVTLPFIGQAAASAITLTLGTALTGIGVYAEKGVRSVQYQFAQLWSGKDGIQATLANISPAFGQALTTILSAARTFVPTFIRDFGPALNAIAGPFKSLGVEIAGSLASPQIASSLQAVGKAFGSILTAITPQIPGDVTAIADGITNVSRAIAKNPKAIADFVSGLAHLAGIALDTIGWLTQIADYLEMHLVPAFRDTQSDLLNWTANVGQFFAKWGHDTEHTFDTVRSFVVATWNATWNDTIGALTRGIEHADALLAGWELTVSRDIGNVVSFFTGLPHRTIQALSGWGNELNAFAHQAVTLLWDGAKSAAAPIVSWFEGFAKGIVGVFKKIWGWFSPSSVMYEGGRALMEGLALGIKDHAHLAMAHATAAAKGISTPFSGGYGVGVSQWSDDVVQALKMEGLSPSLAPRVLYQMMTESGGNPNAINLWDSNARAGDPSRGLMQVIMTTFDAYHWPGTSLNIYDPLANIAAAINYAAHRYGPTLMSGGYGIGSGHGYALGTSSAAPGWAWVGERGPELVRFAGGEQVYPSPVIPGRQGAGGSSAGSGSGATLDDLSAQLDQLIGVCAAAPGGFAGALNGMARSSGYAAMYSTRP